MAESRSALRYKRHACPGSYTNGRHGAGSAALERTAEVFGDVRLPQEMESSNVTWAHFSLLVVWVGMAILFSAGSL